MRQIEDDSLSLMSASQEYYTEHQIIELWIAIGLDNKSNFTQKNMYISTERDYWWNEHCSFITFSIFDTFVQGSFLYSALKWMKGDAAGS